jgi:hypothetical protein
VSRRVGLRLVTGRSDESPEDVVEVEAAGDLDEEAAHEPVAPRPKPAGAAGDQPPALGVTPAAASG